jgi:hypothetical protein
MRLLEIQQRINALMAQFVAEVKGANATGRTDINRTAETVLIPLFAEVFGVKNLENLNIEESANFPAIDLGDKQAGVAIQVTSTPDSEKIKDSLRKFVEHELYKQFKRIRFYILTEKQSSYSAKGFDEINQNRFVFNSREDILDYRDVLNSVMGFQVEKAEKVLAILEKNINDQSPKLPAPVTQKPNQSGKTEIVTLNLLEISFPNTLYIAELLPEVIQQTTKNVPRISFGWGKKKWKSKRELVKDTLDQIEGKFAVDWEFFENKIITFHDLRDEHLPLAQIIDTGTVDPLDPDEFYNQDINQENIFKSLLRKCLQQLLFRRHVTWQNDKHLFIFQDENGEDKREEKWKGKVSSKRLVFERTRNSKEPDKTWYCKHLAFEPQFLQFQNQWFLVIRPDWFFSYDGYSEFFYAAEKLSWLKRQENNDQLHHQLLFLHYFLTHQPPPELFKDKPLQKYPFLSFGDLVSLGDAPYLSDKEWNPPDTSETDTPSDQQMTLDI